MRTALLSLLPLLGFGVACSPLHPYIVGTVSYTAASPVASTSGALPLKAVACAVARTRIVNIHLGDHCTLRGPLDMAQRAVTITGRLVSEGACALPGTGGDVLSLPRATATFQNVGDAVDATVGGTTDDGRYVTYRFTGTYEDGPKDACERLEGKMTPPAVDGRTLVAPGREAWEAWVPEPQRP